MSWLVGIIAGTIIAMIFFLGFDNPPQPQPQPQESTPHQVEECAYGHVKIFRGDRMAPNNGGAVCIRGYELK